MANATPMPALPSLELIAGARPHRELPIVYSTCPPQREPLGGATPSSNRHLETPISSAMASAISGIRVRPETDDEKPSEASARSLQSASGSPAEEEGEDGEARGPLAIVDKRARRKEQCRVNQAAYRKRKRQHEQELARYIKTLHVEIEQLFQQKDALFKLQASTGRVSQRRTRMNPDEEIEAFYQAMETEDTARNDRHESPQAQIAALLALQFEEFESVDRLRRHWRHHSRRFHRFTVRVQSARHLEVGDHVIVKVSADVEIAFVPDEAIASQYGLQWWQTPLVCAVQHQFDVDTASHSISRVVSEVDVVAGVVAAAKRVTRHVPLVLEEFMDICGVQQYTLPVPMP